MNTGHAVGCAALRNGVPCTCWNPLPKPLKPAIVTPNGKIQQLEEQVAQLERQVHDLTVEWRGLQDMAGDQRKALLAPAVRVGDQLHLFGDRVRVLKIEEQDGAWLLTVERLVVTAPNDPGQQG